MLLAVFCCVRVKFGLPTGRFYPYTYIRIASHTPMQTFDDNYKQMIWPQTHKTQNNRDYVLKDIQYNAIWQGRFYLGYLNIIIFHL